MAYDQKQNSEPAPLPNTQPQAPSSISAQVADQDSDKGRNNVPYNKGGENHIAGCTVR